MLKYRIQAFFEPTLFYQLGKSRKSGVFADFDVSLEIASITLLLVLES